MSDGAKLKRAYFIQPSKAMTHFQAHTSPRDLSFPATSMLVKEEGVNLLPPNSHLRSYLCPFFSCNLILGNALSSFKQGQGVLCFRAFSSCLAEMRTSLCQPSKNSLSLVSEGAPEFVMFQDSA